jgi:hypothetical protein
MEQVGCSCRRCAGNVTVVEVTRGVPLSSSEKQSVQACVCPGQANPSRPLGLGHSGLPKVSGCGPTWAPHRSSKLVSDRLRLHEQLTHREQRPQIFCGDGPGSGIVEKLREESSLESNCEVLLPLPLVFGSQCIRGFCTDTFHRGARARAVFEFLQQRVCRVSACQFIGDAGSSEQHALQAQLCIHRWEHTLLICRCP